MSKLSEKEAKYLEERIQNILFEHYRKSKCDLIEEGFYPRKIVKPAKMLAEKCVALIDEELNK